MREITLEELLEAGCHFGHQVTRSNPKAKEFIFEARDNIHIIDLAKTKQALDEAGEYVKTLALEGKSLMVVGTKRQAQTIILDAVKRYRDMFKDENLSLNDNLFYITQRWVGGLLTNLSEIEKNFKKLKDLTIKLQDEQEKVKYTKKEMLLWEREKQRLESLYKGVMNVKGKPDAIFIIDSHFEDLAVREARRTGVPIVAIVDTNADPTIIDYPIPANDDAVGSIRLIVDYLVDSFAEGRKEWISREKDIVKKEIKKTKTPEAESSKSRVDKKGKPVKKDKNK